MPYGLYLSAAGADIQSKRMEVLSNNLANVDTVGFKRELAHIAARHSEAIESGETPAGRGGVDDVGGGVLVHETLTHFSKGLFKPTGVKTDMAIHGDGFFMIQKGDQQYLTRAGNFTIASDGRLTTQEGDDVLSEDGAPIVLNPTGPDLVVNSDGSLRQGTGESIRLALVQPASPSDLVKAGGNRFTALAETQPVAPEKRNVRGESLEQSNVSAVGGMMELMEATRVYESNIRLIQNHDQMLGALLNRVLRS